MRRSNGRRRGFMQSLGTVLVELTPGPDSRRGSGVVRYCQTEKANPRVETALSAPQAADRLALLGDVRVPRLAPSGARAPQATQRLAPLGVRVLQPMHLPSSLASIVASRRLRVLV